MTAECVCLPFSCSPRISLNPNADDSARLDLRPDCQPEACGGDAMTCLRSAQAAHRRGSISSRGYRGLCVQASERSRIAASRPRGSAGDTIPQSEPLEHPVSRLAVFSPSTTRDRPPNGRVEMETNTNTSSVTDGTLQMVNQWSCWLLGIMPWTGGRRTSRRCASSQQRNKARAWGMQSQEGQARHALVRNQTNRATRGTCMHPTPVA